MNHRESRLPAGAAVLVALTVQLTLSAGLVPGPVWVVPALEGALVLGLVAADPGRLTSESKDLRLVSIALIAIISLSNAVALARLVDRLVNGNGGLGRDLLAQAAGVWITNVVVFALTYWEVDRGGPLGRAGARKAPAHPDLWFPQDGTPEAAPAGWAPTFVDYLFVSVTTSTAFSPTDTMPLTPRVKLLQASQGLLSLLTIGLVAARAVNILS